MATYVSGGCLCGAVRYDCDESPMMQGACHCRDCQRQTGSAFATIVIFKKSTMEISGAGYTVFAHKGESGEEVRRGFCNKCGSSVLAEYDVTPDFVVVMAGTLDDPSLIKPAWNIYTAGKQAWVELSPHMKQFEGGFRRD
jgi:hypothetical protein